MSSCARRVLLFIALINIERRQPCPVGFRRIDIHGIVIAKIASLSYLGGIIGRPIIRMRDSSRDTPARFLSVLLCKYTLEKKRWQTFARKFSRFFRLFRARYIRDRLSLLTITRTIVTIPIGIRQARQNRIGHVDTRREDI